MKKHNSVIIVSLGAKTTKMSGDEMYCGLVLFKTTYSHKIASKDYHNLENRKDKV